MRSCPERPTTHDYDSCISLGSDHISLDCGLHRSGVPSFQPTKSTQLSLGISASMQPVFLPSPTAFF